MPNFGYVSSYPRALWGRGQRAESRPRFGYNPRFEVDDADPREDAMADTLYKRLGGYDAIAAVGAHLLPRLIADPPPWPLWQHPRGNRGRRPKPLLIRFLCCSSAWPPF